MEGLFCNGAYSRLLRGAVDWTTLFAKALIKGQRQVAASGPPPEDLIWVNVDDRCVIGAQFNIARGGYADCYLPLTAGER